MSSKLPTAVLYDSSNKSRRLLEVTWKSGGFFLRPFAPLTKLEGAEKERAAAWLADMVGWDHEKAYMRLFSNLPV